MRESLTFLKEFIKHPTKVGAVAPSSVGLVNAMVDWFDWDRVRNVVEFGPGTGVFTEAIVERLHPEATFFAIERSPQMAELARRRCPSATIYEDSATNLNALCDQQGIQSIDAVICGLPWASFPESLQAEIMETMIDRMSDQAQFATFAYWQGVVLPAGRRFSRRLKSSFHTVGRSHTVWSNVPPAFVYRCVKSS
ncbi:methyltransferase domain-containing protein [Stieleria sp. TO1_6]|uniref:class I SAM-dependent methyltransferase n=1 Tax=Stieleria tagensis TaxID=2956795 RepID=UPI00209BABC0|nr:methyltransferase domain-containing protein [Stieleria tagensis]MCO8123431.1 methyltransferase domain-containing protein [Stieleria tagensis]